MEVRPLRAGDDRTAFRSGDPDLDRFLAKYAAQNQFRHHIGTTHVAVEAERILGYVTVAAGHVESEELPATLRAKLPTYPLPVLRLARLAVDSAAQAHGVGKALMRHVFTMALRMSDDYGCIGVVVDAKADAVSYYSAFGFVAIELAAGGIESRPRPTPMFLSLDRIRAALPKRPGTGERTARK